MKAPQLETNNAHVRLVEPNIARDAQLGMEWLNGEAGRATLQSMGNTEEIIDAMVPTTLDQETERVRSFIERDDQLNWMIEYEDHVVGSTWVVLGSSEVLPSPSVHIMIGDPTARGKGVGSAAVGSVLDYLEKQGYQTIYSRHLLTNRGSEKLLTSLDFINLDEPYTADGLIFQNLVRKSKTDPSLQ